MVNATRNVEISKDWKSEGFEAGFRRRMHLWIPKEGEYTHFRCCVLFFPNQVLHHQHGARRLPLLAPAVFTLMLGSAFPSFPSTPSFSNGVLTLPNPILAGVPEESKNWKPQFA